MNSFDKIISANCSLGLVVILFLFFSGFAYSQNTGNAQISNDSLFAIEKKSEKFIEELYEWGIQADSDTIRLSTEFIKLTSDTDYCKTIYPVLYTWSDTKALLNAKKIKQAFWYFINLYQLNKTNKELVVKFVLEYDKAFKADRIILGAFYTYCFTDPAIGVVRNNKPEILHPEVMEQKLSDAKEITNYILYYRTHPVVKDEKK